MPPLPNKIAILKNSLQHTLDHDPVDKEQLTSLMTYYVDQVWPDPECRGTPLARNPSILVENLNQVSNNRTLFPGAAGQDMSDVALLVVPGSTARERFIHGSFQMNDKEGSIIFFTDVGQGLITVQNPPDGVAHKVIWPTGVLFHTTS
ncbi:MAG TPA: hypothetical protein VG097_17630 [Gemmata sp.]|jgi:hypothetical protein|nr:hypothetical protein [Gemmata sp.]